MVLLGEKDRKFAPTSKIIGVPIFKKVAISTNSFLPTLSESYRIKNLTNFLRYLSFLDSNDIIELILQEKNFLIL
jgi:hypothetical protein